MSIAPWDAPWDAPAMLLPPSEEGCVFKHPTVLNYVLGSFLIVAGAISYLPQIIAIVRAKSSEGVSVSALCLGFISASFTFMNKTILSWNELLCCANLAASECYGNNLAVWQTIVLPVGIFASLVVTLIYFPTWPTPELTRAQRERHQRISIALFCGVLVIFFILGSIAAIMHYIGAVEDEMLRTYARIIGISAALAVIVHWAPQIWRTWVLRSPKNFSVLSLAIQAPGTILILIFQGIINHADWSTWVPALLSAIQQILLLIMCLYFLYRERQEQAAAERKPLLDANDDSAHTAYDYRSPPSPSREESFSGDLAPGDPSLKMQTLDKDKDSQSY